MHRRELVRWIGVAGALGVVATARPGRAWLLDRLASADGLPSAAPVAPRGSDRRPRRRDPGSTPPSEAIADAEEPADPDVTATAAAVTVICREALGLAPPAEGGRAHAIERLTLHHTAVRLDDVAHAPGRLRGHQAFHRAQGWPDVAYHVGVDPAGNVYELRDPAISSDTFTDYDPTGHLAIVCEGSYDEQRPTDEMLDALARLIAHLAGRHDVSPSTLSGHRDHAATSCPGGALYDALPALRHRAEALLVDGAPRVEQLCGRAGADRVRSIEVGV